MPCRALEAFGRQNSAPPPSRPVAMGLNALSGIGGVRTYTVGPVGSGANFEFVLMPCRALEAFGLIIFLVIVTLLVILAS